MLNIIEMIRYFVSRELTFIVTQHKDDMVIFAHSVDILPHTPTNAPEHNKYASFGLQNQIAYASTGHPQFIYRN